MKIAYILLLLLASFSLEAALVKTGMRGSTEMWKIDQSIAHSDAAATFAQRFFVYNKITSAADAPIILEVCAEEECTPWPSDLALAAAKAVNGRVVKLEHRFYGESYPFRDLTVENLKFLSVDYALKDLAFLINAIRAEFDWTGKIVTLGCSHGGNLAAYFRALYPELAVGGVAVSAPVRLQKFVPERDEIYAARLGEQCASTFRKNMRAFENHLSSLTNEELAQYLKKFRFNRTDVSRLSLTDILGDFASNIISQRDYPMVCREIKEDSLDPFLYWFDRYIWVYHPEKESIEVAEETSVEKLASVVAIRPWLYQTCTELGYFQISDSRPDRGVGPKIKNADSKLAMCKRLFGVEKFSDEAEFNRRYYEPVRGSSRLFFANNVLDFWTMLSITPENNTNPAIGTYLAREGGHCSIMKDVNSGVPGTGATAVIEAVKSWIQ